MRVDYVIIGAGMAGTVLAKLLQNERTVVLDPRPGAYKIGESIIPEHFHHPLLRELVPDVRRLDTFSEKIGTTFTSHDAIAAFPLSEDQARWSMHVGRQELERLMHERWATPIVRERVVHVDPPGRRVRTDERTYEVAHQILDCSGPAMVVARALGDVTPIAPVYSRWAYFDITEIDQERFRHDARISGKTLVAYDLGRLRTVEAFPSWQPSHTTSLTQLSEGVWTWQIPLARRTLLSFGVVSRHGPVTDEMLFDLAEKKCAPCYRLRRTATRGGTPFARVHQRNHFACRASVAATEDYVLLGDAFAFADPIYSVGTGLAVSKAIEVAELLNRGPWCESVRARYCASYDALVARAVEAFELWYSGALLRDDPSAHEVQHGFLEGNAFQTKVAEAYHDALADVVPPSGGVALRVEVAQRVITLLHISSWTLSSVEGVQEGLIVCFERPDHDRVHVAIRWAPCERFYCRAGSATLAYVSIDDDPAELDPAAESLLQALRSRVEHHDAELRSITNA